jgi:hypothetical protein
MSTQQFGSELRVIGPRRSGKTTYLATLLDFYHQQQAKAELFGLDIQPRNNDPKDPACMLKNLAHNILRQGGQLAATYKEEKIQQYPTYALNINFPQTKLTPKTMIELVTKDYPGEIFEDIIADGDQQDKTHKYLDDLFQATGWLIILTDYLSEKDVDDIKKYHDALERLGDELHDRGKKNAEIRKLRVAVVMSKCERGEIWPCRLDAEEELFSVRLPEVHRVLTQKISARNLKFFACSSFGIMGDRRDDFDPRPNRFVPDDGSPPEYAACIRDSTRWKPFGLINPIYWLATGQMLSNPRL